MKKEKPIKRYKAKKIYQRALEGYSSSELSMNRSSLGYFVTYDGLGLCWAIKIACEDTGNMAISLDSYNCGKSIHLKEYALFFKDKSLSLDIPESNKDVRELILMFCIEMCN